MSRYSVILDGRPIELTLLERPADDAPIHVLVVCYKGNLYESRHALHALILEEIGLRGRLPILLCQTKCDLEESSVNSLSPVDAMQIPELCCFGWEYISHSPWPYEKQPKDPRARITNQASCSALTQKGLKNVFDTAMRLALYPIDQRDKKRCCIQ